MTFKRTQWLIAIALATALAASLQAQTPTGERPAGGPTEPKSEKVPFLGELPLLSTLFTKAGGHNGLAGGDPLWFVLEDQDLGTVDPSVNLTAATLPFARRWLLASLRREVPELQSATLVENITTRYLDGARRVQVRRGIDVAGPPTAVTRAREYLTRCDAVRKRRVSFELYALTAPSTSDAGAQHDGGVALVDRSAFEKRRRQLKAMPGGTEVALPRLTLVNGVEGNVFAGDRVAYVKDFKVEVVASAAIADPVIATVNDGITVTLAPAVHPDGKTVSLEAAVVAESLRRPIEDAELTTLGSRKVTIQTPDTAVSRWSSSDLLIGEGFEGFVVEGLGYYLSNEAWGKEGPRRLEVWVLLKVEPDAAADVPPTGSVLGVDSGRVIVRWPDATAERPRGGVPTQDKFSIVRDEMVVGEAMLVEQIGTVTVLTLQKGEARIGDGVR